MPMLDAAFAVIRRSPSLFNPLDFEWVGLDCAVRRSYIRFVGRFDHVPVLLTRLNHVDSRVGYPQAVAAEEQIFLEHPPLIIIISRSIFMPRIFLRATDHKLRRIRLYVIRLNQLKRTRQ